MKHLRIATAMRGALSIAVVLFFSLPTAVWAEDENVEPAQSEEQSEKKKEDKSSEKSDDKSAEVDLSGLELDLPKEEKKEEKKKPEVAGASEYQLQDALVFGQRHKDATSASEFNVELERLHIIPRKSAAEQLMLAPGVLTTNHGGEGHANETFMRGFAAGEGQDIEFTVDGVPINEISNPHAHGYADLHFIPPEFVHTVEITEGTFDASQGDFAFAGSANYRLGVSERGARLSTGAGSFNSQRMVLAYAPPDDSDETFAGFEFYTTDGHGENRAAQRAIALGRYTDDEGEGGLKWSLSAYGYAARYDSAGIVRQDDYEAGRMGFTDSYDSNQGGESARLLLALSTSFGSAKARFSQTVFIGQRTLRIRSNFTGWMTDVPYELDGTPVATQRGDGVEMRYSAFTGGSRGSYDL
ncbi:TonB-dependent receptor plug domain-containing protein, partial [Myxococcota bacterium]|nr:TonB-dependent receptor plug domain-containing protein [Myxococcota bacterium]